HGIEVADNGTRVGTMYDATGKSVVGTVRVPRHNGETGAPTGVAINSDSTRFLFSHDTKSAQFIYVTENGTIDAWSGTKADRRAAVMIDNSSAGAVYKGDAIGIFHHRSFLFAANFTGGRVEVYNALWEHTHLVGRFNDPNL